MTSSSCFAPLLRSFHTHSSLAGDLFMIRDLMMKNLRVEYRNHLQRLPETTASASDRSYSRANYQTPGSNTMFLRGAFYAILVVSVTAFTANFPASAGSTTCASSLTRVNAAGDNHGWDLSPKTTVEAFKTCAAGGLLAACLLMTNPLPTVAADGARIVGEFQGSGLVFKDTLKVESFDDPKIKGVTLYVSNFERPLTERLSKDFFSDPSDASVGCARTGPVVVADNIARGTKVREEKCISIGCMPFLHCTYANVCVLYESGGRGI